MTSIFMYIVSSWLHCKLFLEFLHYTWKYKAYHSKCWIKINLMEMNIECLIHCQLLNI